jgi:hypothetical protein
MVFQPGMAGAQFPGPDDQSRKIAELERLVQQFAAANVLATAGISATTGGVMVNGFMEFQREDGTRGVQVDPVTGSFAAYDASGDNEVARFGALQTTPGDYGVEVLVGDTWVQLGAQVATWENLSGIPADFAQLVTSPVANAENAAQAANASRADHADGVTPEAFAREVAGVPGSWYAMYMHSNGTMGRGTSSHRYKKNIRDFSLTPEQLLQLRPVIYDRKAKNADDYTPAVSADEVGLIAEEVEQVAPELVEYFDGQVDNVRYHLLGVALLPLVQAHERTIDQQATDIAELRQAVRDLGGNI